MFSIDGSPSPGLGSGLPRRGVSVFRPGPKFLDLKMKLHMTQVILRRYLGEMISQGLLG